MKADTEELFAGFFGKSDVDAVLMASRMAIRMGLSIACSENGVGLEDLPSGQSHRAGRGNKGGLFFAKTRTGMSFGNLDCHLLKPDDSLAGGRSLLTMVVISRSSSALRKSGSLCPGLVKAMLH
jgi:hypothetical protein